MSFVRQEWSDVLSFPRRRIHSAGLWQPTVDGLDSCLDGNDEGCEGSPIPNDTLTGQGEGWVFGN